MDAAEFKERVLPLGRKLLHYACQLLHDVHEAEDAVQEVVLKLWNNRESIEGYHSLEAYSLKMMRNWCLDRLKAKKPVYIDGYQAGFDRPTDEANPYRKLEQNDRLTLLRSLLNRLPEQQKQIIELRDLEGLEYDQIEMITGMNLNALRVNLSRARTRLRDEMKKIEGYGYHENQDTAGKIL
jgi:RNA polymerase sigma-70 factor (ECF subfamily)